MATSILSYKNKYLDVKDSIFLIGLHYVLQCIRNKEQPPWFKDYIENVIQVVVNIQPVGWGYMKLDEYFILDDRKKYFINILKNCIHLLSINKTRIIDYKEINQLLKLKDFEKLEESNYIEMKIIIYFINDLILLLDDEIPVNHKRLMKVRKD